MKIIDFKKENRKDWNRFIFENNSESFLQSFEWGEFQTKTGRRIFRIALEDENKICAIAQIIKNSMPFGKNYLYCPRGPVFKNEKYLDILFEEIKKIGKREKSVFLKIDPPLEKNKHQFSNLKKSLNEIQPKDTLMLDLGKSEDILLKEMKQKTRYNIRLAEKRGVEIISTSDYEKYFSCFWDLIKETSKRNNIISHKKDYYYKMIESLSFECENGLSAKLYLAKFKERIIAANILLYFSDIAIYLHGASSNEHRNLMAPYLLQWKQIQDAKNSGYKKYDFWGVSSDTKCPKGHLVSVSFKKNNWKGITRFKKGFGGVEKSYIGACDLPLKKLNYGAYRVLKKIL